MGGLHMTGRSGNVAALSLVLWTLPAAAQGPFQTFWKAFQAAVVRNDKPVMARMTRLPIYLDSTITDRATLVRALDRLFDADTRACFAKAKPERDKNYYSVRCGQLVFGFDGNEGTWKFTGTNPVQ